MPTETFTSAADWTVPDGVGRIFVTAYGGKGQDGDASGGSGGTVNGELSVTPGETLYIRFTSGGSSDGANGGDGADIRRGGTSLSDRAVVAGGGGSGGQEASSNAGGGDGGADTGQDGADSNPVTGGKGGTQSSGGAAGTGGDYNGTDGSFGQGGDGGSFLGSYSGSGGGGWYGGGGGGLNNGGNAGGGGGGSNYTGGLAAVSANERGTSPRSTTQGEIQIQYLAAPTNVLVTNSGGDADLTWTDPSGSFDRIEVHRSQSPGVDTSGTPLATVNPGVEQYTDTGVVEGRDYYYRLVTVDTSSGLSSADSTEVSISIPLPAPTNLTVTDVGAASASVSWTDNASDEDGYRVEISPDDDGNWTTAVDGLAPDTESATITGLLNGQLYGVRVVVYAGSTEEVDQ